MNLIEIAGFLGADPEERFTTNGRRVIEMRVATRGRKDETIWWRVNIWGDRFDKMLPYLKKGSAVIVIGEMRKPDTYISNKDGTPQVSLTVDADIIRFSPFGRTDKVETPRQSTPRTEQPASEQFASYGVGQETPQPENAFAGDDLPF